MSGAIQLAIVGAVIAAAAVYLLRRSRRPRPTCDRCPAAPGEPRLVRIREKRADQPSRPLKNGA